MLARKLLDPRSLLLLGSVALASAACGGDDPASSDVGGGPRGDALAAEYPLGDPRQFAEGGAFDHVERAFYVGSLEHGNIVRVSQDGEESVFHGGSGEPGRVTLGMKVDEARRRLWVCTTLDSLGSVWIFDIDSGDRLTEIDLTEVMPEAACNDLLLEDDGTALVTDRENPIIYKVDPDGGASVWTTHSLLGASFVHLNGLTRTPDRKYLLTATYAGAKLLRIRADDPTDVTEVELHGDAFAAFPSGPDDLEFVGDDLVVACDSTIKRLIPDDASWSRAEVRSTESMGGVTALIEAEDHMYAVNGQSVAFVFGQEPAPFEIFRIEPGSLK